MMHRPAWSWRIGLGIGVLIVVALLALSGVRGFNGLRLAEQASATAGDLEPQLIELKSGSVLDTAALQGRVAEVGAQLSRARSELTPFVQISPYFGWVPGLGPRLRSARDVLELGEDLIEASRDLLAAVELVTGGEPGRDRQILQGTRVNQAILTSVALGEPFYQSALERLREARGRLESLRDRDLPRDFRGLIASAQRVVPELETFARAGLAASQSWRSFLGFDLPQTYLIVAQNADELRASGGFIPGAWVLELDQGEIVRLEFFDTSDVDDLEAQPPLPPEGLLQALWAGVWLFRDASWFPDYPTSARAIQQIFRLGQGISVDGVISLDQWAIQALLEALGPVRLLTGEEIDASSYLEQLELQTDLHGHVFMDTLLQSVLDRLRQQGSSGDFISILAAMNRSLSEKHLLLSFKDPALQRMVRSNGWDGALAETDGDYLMVVDSNVGFSKVNRNIEQRIDYQVELRPDGRASARLEIIYTNASKGAGARSCAIQAVGQSGVTYQEQKNACYWNYLRIYTPGESQLRSASPFPMPQGALYRRLGYNDIEETLRSYTENEKQVHAALFTVEVGKTRKVTFAYDLPARIGTPAGDQLTYTLLLQKQPGTRSTPVSVNISLPPGYQPLRSNLTPVDFDGRRVRYAVDLSADTVLRLVLGRGGKAASLFTAARSRQPRAAAFEGGITAVASIVVTPPTAGPGVDLLQVFPTEAVVAPGQQILFNAVALDAVGRPLANVRFQWRTSSGAVGAISDFGLFTAGPAPGVHVDSIHVTAISPHGSATAFASVEIVSLPQAESRVLDQVLVYPAGVTVKPGQVTGIAAIGWDAGGRFIQGVQYRWTMADGNAGKVDQLGFFSAGQTPGHYPNAVEVTAFQGSGQGRVEQRAYISVTVTENPRRGFLDQLIVLPNRVVLEPGREVEFIARPFDETGRVVRGVTLSWRVSGPGVGAFRQPGRLVAGSQDGRFPNGIEVLATQATPEGVVTRRAVVSVTIASAQGQAALASAIVIPGSVNLSPGQRLLFFATGLDPRGNVVPTEADWAIGDPAAGSIDRKGLFVASDEPGVYPDAVRVTMVQRVGERVIAVQGFAAIIIHGPLARVEILPRDLVLEAGESARLRATGYDATGIELPFLLFRWSMKDPAAGAIDETGLFTAGGEPGEFPDAISVRSIEVRR